MIRRLVLAVAVLGMVMTASLPASAVASTVLRTSETHPEFSRPDASQGSAIPAASSAGECDPVWFIGARGSGESAGTNYGYSGMGGPVSYLAKAVAGYLKAKGVAMNYKAVVKYKTVDYSADSVDVLIPNKAVLALLAIGQISEAVALYVTTSADPYDASLDRGIAVTEDDVASVLTACPDAKIILAGYSQGAAAVHDAENWLAKNRPSEFRHVTGALLLGDPDRVQYTKAKTFGSAPRDAEGLRVELGLVKAHEVPDPAETAEIANAGDFVGDFAISHIDTRSRAEHSASVHTSYTKTAANLKILTKAATWIASLIRPVITTTSLPAATVSKAYSAELTTADHRKGTWKITSGKLPAGLSLSGYTISGTPTTASRSTFTVKFTDTTGETATATVAITVADGTYPVDLNTLCQDPGAENSSVNGCPYDGVAEVGSESFSYAAYVDDNDSSVYPTYWDLLDFPAGTCRSVQVTFGIPESGGEPGDSVYLQVSDGAGTYVGTAEYGKLATFTAPLNGKAWSVSNSATNADDEIAINLVATCSTANGAPGS